jgi:hypothetical protein
MTGDRVFRFGQTTFETSTRVLSPVASNIKLDMRFGSYKFVKHIEIEAPAVLPFADGGHSGALVYDERDRAVGIVIGGNGTRLAKSSGGRPMPHRVGREVRTSATVFGSHSRGAAAC